MFDFQVLGSKIVDELTTLTDKNVLVTDKNGYVIASTDPARVNAFHEGASLAMKNQQPLHMTKEMCENLVGVRPGIVMPIIIADLPIGVLGITGNPAEVEKYAKLVKKVAELFITDLISRQEKERGIREIEFFFFDMVTSDSSFENIGGRAKMLNIDTSLYQRIAMMQTNRQYEIEDVENLLRIQTIHPEMKIIRWGLERLILLLPNVPKQELIIGLKRLAQKIAGNNNARMPVGVGKAGDFPHLKESFKQAEMANAVSARQGEIVFEEDLKLELLYYSIPKEVQEEFIARTIAPLLEEVELLHNLEVFLQKRTSVQAVADELHIHKNTLLYRLNKIENMLSINLTDNSDIATIYTALRLYRKK
ncbi:MAG TPA: sugar diacid recognition domain-containing protein [Planococcus sp. (in: firmicutes)]|nr:sugar diacid recognition domain-containing protein [Planococcus sp. (in: firmicutes)]